MIVTHQLRDAFFIATHTAEQVGGRLRVAPADPASSAVTEFLMLRDGKIAFEGPAEELRGSKDEYLRAFLS
jgi:hypothetical protein